MSEPSPERRVLSLPSSRCEDLARLTAEEGTSRARRCTSTVGVMVVALLSLLLLLVSRQRGGPPPSETKAAAALPLGPQFGLRPGQHGKLRRHERSQWHEAAEHASRAHRAVSRRQAEQPPTPQYKHTQQEIEVFDREVSRTVREAQTDPNSMFDMSTP